MLDRRRAPPPAAAGAPRTPSSDAPPATGDGPQPRPRSERSYVPWGFLGLAVVAIIGAATLDMQAMISEAETLETPASTSTPAGGSTWREAARTAERARAREAALATASAALKARAQAQAGEQAHRRAPSFDVVRMETSGAGLFAGHASAGAAIVVRADGAYLGGGVADERGEWVVIPDRVLGPGAHEITLAAVSQDDGDMRSPQRLVISIAADPGEKPLIVLSEPGHASRPLQRPDDAPRDIERPSVATVDYDGHGEVVIAGSGRPGAIVRVYLDEKFVGEAAIDDAGGWEARPTEPVAVGVYTLRVDQINAAGAVDARFETSFTRDPLAIATNADASASAAADADAAANSADWAKTVVAVAPPPPPQPRPERQPDARADADAPEPAELAAPELAEPRESLDRAAAEAALAAAANAAPEEQMVRVEVRPGDTLWKIAQRVYGVGERYTLIYRLNSGRLTSPNQIYPGQLLLAPAPVAETDDAPPRG